MEVWAPADYSHQEELLEAALVRGLQDNLTVTRAAARAAICAYQEAAPERAAALLKKLDASVQARVAEAAATYERGALLRGSCGGAAAAGGGKAGAAKPAASASRGPKGGAPVRERAREWARDRARAAAAAAAKSAGASDDILVVVASPRHAPARVAMHAHQQPQAAAAAPAHAALAPAAAAPALATPAPSAAPHVAAPSTAHAAAPRPAAAPAASAALSLPPLSAVPGEGRGGRARKSLAPSGLPMRVLGAAAGSLLDSYGDGAGAATRLHFTGRPR
jgi:hypothetical protein